VEANRDSLRPLLAVIGRIPLKDLTVQDMRSVRAHGDTKTNRSRRTLKLPEIAVEALRGQRERQARERDAAGEAWQEHGLVFTTSVGTGYESHNLRRDFRRVTAAAGLGARWVPKELRTSFVSMMSYQGVPVEEIAPAGRACQLAHDRGDLPAGVAAGDHYRGRGHGPDLPPEAAARKCRGCCRMKNLNCSGR